MKKRVYLPVLLICCIMLLSSASFGRGHIPVTGTGTDLQNDSVCSGIIAYFVFGASDTSANPLPTITYAWQLSTNGGTTWSSLTTGGPYAITDSSLSVTSSLAVSGYRFRCIATDSLGSDTSAVAWLRVDTANWGTITGPASVCVGSSITETCSIPGGAWSVANDTASITATGVLTGLLSNGSSAGKDTVYYYNYNTCGSNTDTAYITINPVPATGIISGPSIICKGATITLTESVSGGTWSRSHPLVDSFAGTGIVRGISQGFDTIKYTTYNGLCYLSTTHPIRVDTNVVAMPITGPSVGCVGHTIDLMNVNIYGTWVWSVSNSHASVNTAGHVYGLSGGVDTITYSFTNACNAVTSTTSVEIDTLLSPGVISAASYAVCAGSWIHLSESISTGFWLSSNPLLAIVDGSGNVTGVAQGTPVISYVLSNGCGDVAATHTVNVYRAASAITGPDSVGIGNTITLTDSATTGTSEIWSIADTTIATIGSSTGIVTGVAAGATTATYTLINACGTTTATQTIYVGPPPFVSVIDGNDSVCKGSSITLSDTVSGGVWSASNSNATVASAGPNSATVTGVSYGQVIITYTVHNGFGSSSNETAVYVNQAPAIVVKGPSLVALGGDYFLFGYPAGGAWTESNSVRGEIVSTGVVDTAVIVAAGDTLRNTAVTWCSYVVTKTGLDTLTYTYTNSCGTRSTNFVINLAGPNVFTPVINGSSENLLAYPNPSNGEFTLNLTSPNNETAAITVTDLVGQKVREFTLPTNNRYTVQLDQPAGIYLITAVMPGGSRYYSKITITR